MREGAPLSDRRSHKDIIAEISELSKALTPEWKFDLDSPDVGTALACVFANRFHETIEYFNKMPENHKRNFYNMLGANLLPAVPATGVVQFFLAGDTVEGSFVPKEFKLFSPVIDDRGTRMIFETQSEIFVTSNEIIDVIYTDEENDLLCFWENRNEIFSPSMRNNSQQHKITFFHQVLQSIEKRCCVFLIVNSVQSTRWLKNLADPDLAVFYQKIGDENKEISCFYENSQLRLGCLSDGSEVTLLIKDKKAFANLSLDSISLKATGNGLTLNPIVKGELENKVHFDVFGSSPDVYDDLILECPCAFSQKGSVIKIHFTLGFSVVEIGEIPEIQIPNKMFVWKKDLPKPERVPITVAEVVWEYWNGFGFAPLVELSELEHTFSGLDINGDVVDTENRMISFVCPQDLEPVFLQAAQRLCIRVRVKRIENRFSQPALVYIPWIENLYCSFSYNQPINVTDITAISNGEESVHISDFISKELEDSTIYIGFAQSPSQGPMTLCITIGEEENYIDGLLDWYQLTSDGWKLFDVQNDKNAFKIGGILSFNLKQECVKSKIYGRAAYWLKVKLPARSHVELKDISLNCTAVIQLDTVESYCSDKEIQRIQLQHNNVQNLDVYINTSNKDGLECWEQLKHGWALDRANGVVSFSPKLVIRGNSRTVKLCYSHGGGSSGNFPAGQSFVPSLSIGFVRGAINPNAFSEGCDEENAENAEFRLAREIRHQNRPVTRQDYVDLLLDDEICAAQVHSLANGEVSIVVTTSGDDISQEKVKARVYQKLMPILPLGIGIADILVESIAEKK